MSLDQIVSVSITVQSTSPSRTGFGTPLIFDYNTVFPERARIYSDTAGMISDGFLASDAAVIMAGQIFAQNPKVKQVVVGRAEGAPLMTRVLTPIVKDSTLYRVTINGENFDFTSDATATAAEITAGLEPLINAGAQNVLATDNTGTLTIEAAASPGGAATAGIPYRLEVDRSLLTQDDTTPMPATDIATDLAAIRTDPSGNDDWYAMMMTVPGTLSVGTAATGAAAAIEATGSKILLVDSADDDILADTAGNLGETLNTAGYARTALMYHPRNHSYAAAAWGGAQLPKDPGSTTWKFKTLSGVPFYALTPTEQSNLEANEVNFYTEVAGVAITCNGTMAEGEFIDVIRSRDFLTARIQENVFERMVNLEKISFTDQGIGVITNEVRGVLNLGISQGILAADPEPTVTAPRARDVSNIDKANRFLPDVEFTATLAGAIHATEITGVISL